MNEVVSGLTVNRWKRYGKDRLYVTVGDDVKVGYWDLLSGEGYPESPEQEAVLLAAVEAWRAEQDTEEPAIPVVTPELTHDTIAAAEADAVGSPALTPEPLVTSRPADPEAPALIEADLVESPARPWIDLTTNRAGAEARGQALAARDVAPIKTFVARALGVPTDERAWRIGADGEEKVAAQLGKVAKKDPRWLFLHSIPVGNRGSDIDHFIVGPAGVFTVNAKHHPRAKIWVGGNTFMVNGRKQPYIRNSRYEATRAGKLLTAACGFPIHAEGLIVTVNAQDVVVKNAPDGVHIVPRMQVAKWLLRHGDILDEKTINIIYEAARRSTTWRPGPIRGGPRTLVSDVAWPEGRSTPGCGY